MWLVGNFRDNGWSKVWHAYAIVILICDEQVESWAATMTYDPLIVAMVAETFVAAYYEFLGSKPLNRRSS